MTDEQINAAIAEACGWQEITNCTCGGKKRGCPPGGHASTHTPNYCTDLNAMHETEKVLDYEQCEAFSNTVADIVCAENREKDYPFPWHFARIHATARQRAEAFLRTLKKWKERQSCKVCGKPAKGHGLCLMHYQRWKKYGDPLLTKRFGRTGAMSKQPVKETELMNFDYWATE